MTKPAPIDFETRVLQYRQLRDKIKEEQDAFKAAMQPKLDMLQRLHDIILLGLQNTKQDSAKTKHGTAYLTTKNSATIADAGAFRRHVIGTQAFDLVDWKANPVAVAAFIEENKDAPPGVNFSSVLRANVRK